MARVRRILCSGSSDDRAGEVGLLVLRVFAGLSLALAHGWMKLPPSEQFIDGVGNLGFPVPGAFAWAATLAEFAGGILLALGLFTRPAAFFVLFTMGVAAFGQHLRDPFSVKEMALLYGAIALMYLLKGAGRLSVDALLRR